MDILFREEEKWKRWSILSEHLGPFTESPEKLEEKKELKRERERVKERKRDREGERKVGERGREEKKGGK